MNSIKHQSVCLKENIGTSPEKDQDVTDTESRKPVESSSCEIICNGVKEGETLVNGDVEKTDEDSSEPENLDNDIVNDSDKVEISDGSVPETNGEVKSEEKVDTYEPSEKDEIESSVLENSIKEPDKTENNTDSNTDSIGLVENTEEQNCDEVSTEEEKVDTVLVEVSDISSDNVDEKEQDTVTSEDQSGSEQNIETHESEVIDDKEKQVDENSVETSATDENETESIENDVKTSEDAPAIEITESLDVSDVKEKPPEELTKITGEVTEHSNSSGPPSLVKEINSDDNSVLSNSVSVTSDNVGGEVEESMEIDEKPLSEISQSESKCDIEEKEVKPMDVEEVKSELEVNSIEKESENEVSNDFMEENNTIPEKETKIDSSSVIQSKTMSKGQKLDQLLSKITTKAETDSQKTPPPQKHAKARKSCVNSSNSTISKPSIPSSITSLTFNVKELEKKGVLDMPKPKPSKRKAFEPIKIPSPEKDKVSSPPKKGSPVRSPLKSPIKSPNKTENPFFKKQKLIRRKKKKAYKLPGEKVWKRTKSKKSEERQLNKDDEIQANKAANEQNVRQRGASMPVNSTPNKVLNISSEHTADNTKSPPQRNALDMLTMNSRKSFSSASSGGSMKKARKTVRQGIDPATHRTLDSFLKNGSHSRKVCRTVSSRCN